MINENGGFFKMADGNGGDENVSGSRAKWAEV